MKLRRIMFSQVVRLLQATRPAGALYGPAFIKGITDRYGFAKYPESIRELIDETEKGVQFEHGRLLQPAGAGNKPLEVVINKFSIHQDGIVVVSTSTVENTELFCNDVLAWAKTEFDLQYIDSEPLRITYTSQVEIQIEPKFLDRFSFLSNMQSAIAEAFYSYGIMSYEYECSGFSMHFDHANKSLPVPGVFQIERRGGQEFEKNIFFSQAPLKTAEHLRLLGLIEGL